VDGVPYCRLHLSEVVQLTRNGFKILSCINSEVDSVQEICKVTKLSKERVKSTLTSLAEQQFIATSGILSFFTRKITADGIWALGIWSNVFSQDEDVMVVFDSLADVNDNGKKNGTIYGT
jgi:RIO-like serine/threonine protein kinase